MGTLDSKESRYLCNRSEALAGIILVACRGVLARRRAVTAFLCEGASIHVGVFDVLTESRRKNGARSGYAEISVLSGKFGSLNICVSRYINR